MNYISYWELYREALNIALVTLTNIEKIGEFMPSTTLIDIVVSMLQ
jgi:hypothetical protein